MKAAIVPGPGEAPVLHDIPEPSAGEGERRVRVTAAAVSPITRSRASGGHYSSAAAFPHGVGIDGIGRLDDGSRVYFVLPRTPFGAIAERTVVAASRCLPLPDDLDDVTAAAIANPGMSSWAALTERAALRAGETVLVNGGTGASGRLAVRIAKHLGARKVIATGRDTDALRSLAALGADVTLPLLEDGRALDGAFTDVFSAGVDVVIDYLWGPSAERLLRAAAKAGADAVPIRFVHVGAASAAEITLPSAVLRSSAIQLMGSGIGSIPLDRMLLAIDGVLHAAVPAGLRIAVDAAPLADFERGWAKGDGQGRTVFTMEA